MALSLGLSLGGVVPAVVGCLDAGAFEGDIFGSISTAAGVCGLGITLIASGFTILIAGGTGLSKSMEGDLSRMRVIVSGAGQQSSLGSHRFHLALRFSAGSLSLSGSF